MKLLVCLALVAFFSQVKSFSGSEDRFIKKYAMMKIYESCFGEDVVKQIRKELKLACAKCASLSPPSEAPTTTPHPEEKPQEDHIGPNSNAVPQPSYRPYGGIGPASFYNPPMANPGYPAPMFYPGIQQIPFSPYSFPMIGQQYFGSRIARGMDFKSQLESIPSRLHGKFKNVSCVMQELGYLDDNYEPNYVKISERISNLPVSEELRRDMQDGVTFCQQFSQCVPEVKKDKLILSRELMRPMFFFKCYKHKKLEACIMKDLRQKYGNVDEEELEDDDLEIRRQGKDMKLTSTKEIDELAASVYEFLYSGDGGFDIDGLL
ncbi:uncharacterized protein LOC108910840 isoform X2 [Anoplophora glabripennis]|uniref:uncharacterized protein LOC108910840 isoform X2 n=1 Tax=Anoplophora glabripennis TaxID=217634 RepID=UPI000873C9CE|nr:uncharacterized protein LOC108910840 isoform X2 [Anoplophora glabripennis]